ncbi:hypothetical protein PQR33_36130 [Paraburkholderia sediminicola]|uniref:hypothetical protein n=1 Tax=Paraburkholderia sediminicola TaxID=458836 RepID=UPI0038BB64FC
MHIATVIAGLVVLLIAWRWYARRDREVKAANNAVAAKLTFSRMSGDDQTLVTARAHQICERLRGEKPDFSKFSEPQKLLLMSLAMYELEIPPAIEYMKRWNVVRNPFLAISGNSRTLEMVAAAVSRSEGVELTIDQTHPVYSAIARNPGRER